MIWLLCAALAAPMDDFVTAYDAEDYDAAVAVLEAVDSPSGAVLYNLGAAHYRSGDVPRAIAAWRGATRYHPRNGDIAHSLAIARGDLETEPPPPVDPPRAWQAFLTSGELGVLGLLFAAAGSALAVFARRHRQPLWGAALAWVAGLVIGVTAVAGALTAAEQPVAVEVDKTAVVRSGPMSSASRRFSLVPGTEVLVTGRQGGFLRVHTGDDRRGWVPTGAVAATGIPNAPTEEP